MIYLLEQWAPAMDNEGEFSIFIVSCVHLLLLPFMCIYLLIPLFLFFPYVYVCVLVILLLLVEYGCVYIFSSTPSFPLFSLCIMFVYVVFFPDFFFLPVFIYSLYFLCISTFNCVGREDIWDKGEGWGMFGDIRWGPLEVVVRILRGRLFRVGRSMFLWWVRVWD